MCTVDLLEVLAFLVLPSIDFLPDEPGAWHAMLRDTLRIQCVQVPGSILR